MISKKIIFVGGVHGVGKTTLCAKIAGSYNYTHYSASELIKDKEIEAVSCETKNVIDIDNNQHLLELALLGLQEKNILLDGHFTLLDSTGVPQEIPEGIFQSICPHSLLVLTETPEVIAERINGRDNNDVTVSFIEAHQRLEILRAKEIATILKIKIYEVTSETNLTGML